MAAAAQINSRPGASPRSLGVGTVRTELGHHHHQWDTDDGTWERRARILWKHQHTLGVGRRRQEDDDDDDPVSFSL